MYDHIIHNTLSPVCTLDNDRMQPRKNIPVITVQRGTRITYVNLKSFSEEKDANTNISATNSVLYNTFLHTSLSIFYHFTRIFKKIHRKMYGLEQESANRGLQAKSSLTHRFVNKILLKHS